ncbi:MAG: CDP-diacylglycerol--serine O-phosphatidyltransferase [Bacteroidetes bacterium]|nr:CDP-diacylglycerol--serine O-phosphatidyltransferase [Bacteroidota bacterium]
MKKYIPNIFTSFNLLCGCLSVVNVASHNLDDACYFIFLAAVFDFLDGFLARKLNAFSPLGLQLDSLADMVSFGVAPGFIMFRFIDDHAENVPELTGEILKYCMLLVPLFSALRLAKFNIDDKQKEIFYGLPTPANALLLASLPLIAYKNNFELLQNPWFIAVTAMVFAILLILPVKLVAFKFKDYTWNNNRHRYIFLLICILLFITLQFSSVPLIIVLYIVYSLYKTI